MELTNPINNQHMVDGLGVVLRAILDAEKQCESILESSDEAAELALATEFIAKHHQHIRLISDAMRFLGGAPGTIERSPDKGRIRSALLSSPSLRSTEEKIISLCEAQIKRLTGSDEATEKLNLIREDINASLNH